MFRDTNAIFVLVVLITITVSPLFQTTVCEMPCCTELKVSCCEPADEPICSSFIDCGEVGFTIVIPAPIQKQYQQFVLEEFLIALFTDVSQDHLLKVFSVENLSSYLLTHQNLPLLA
tara:strand:- start:387 stop:737 length:351 start_codon:yes stop_codon:yes gene_type:complete